MDNVRHTHSSRSMIVLIDRSRPTLYSLFKILETNSLILGVVFCSKQGIKNRLKIEKRSIKKYGLLFRISQILLTLYFYIKKINVTKSLEKKIYPMINFSELKYILKHRNIPMIETDDYESPNVLNFVNNIQPDFLVAHTPYWIGKKIRDASKLKLVIGSHPGIVPYYRGAHSSFWCLYDSKETLNGYSIFALDNGVDSGPIIFQRKISYDQKISYKENEMILMKLISEKQSEIVSCFSMGDDLDFTPQKNLSDNQIKKAPGICDYFKFLRKSSGR